MVHFRLSRTTDWATKLRKLEYLMGSNSNKNMNKDNSRSRNGSNLGYYCGAKFDTIPTLSILPALPNHWKLSESKSTPSSPVPTSVFETNMRHSSGSSVPDAVTSTSGRNTAPVLKAASLPSPTGHDINASYKKMIRSGEKTDNSNDIVKREQAMVDSQIVHNHKGKKKGRIQKKQKEHAGPVTPAAHQKGASVAPTPVTKEASSKEGHILMAMLQSGRMKTESIKTDLSPQLAPTESFNVQSSPVKITSLESMMKLNSELSMTSPSKQSTYMYGASCQQRNLNYYSEENRLKALLKVCT